MKKLLVSLALLPLAALADQVRILPLGDSITEGVGWEAGGGYRAVLREMLVEAGYSVDYVGSNESNPGSMGDDRQHEGHSGWKIDDLRANLPVWFKTVEDPHVILLMVGTNDYGHRYDPQHVLQRYGALLDELSIMQPSARILAATLTPCYYENVGTANPAAFNTGLPALVAEHVARGQNVTLVDMHAKMADAPFPDSLHPGEAGYRQMAQAWFEAITNVLPVAETVSMPPNALAAVYTEVGWDCKGVRVYFNRPVSGESEQFGNFAYTGGFVIDHCYRDNYDRAINTYGPERMSTDEFTYLTVRNVKARDDASVIAPRTFTVGSPHGARHHVDEAKWYRPVYALDIPESSAYGTDPVNYRFDDHANVGSFSRVAYYLELEDNNNELTYVWVSMDAFTSDASKLGVPTRASGAVFQQYVKNLVVRSNAYTAFSGTRSTGNIEFWPDNYISQNYLGIEGAYDDRWDCDDTRSAGEGNYGSMQIHDTGYATPILCYNNWGQGATACVGAGVGRSSCDWTESNNAGNYRYRSLEVYVLNASTPSLVSTRLISRGARLEMELDFDQPIVAADCTPDRFTLSDGTRVVSVGRFDDGARLILTLATSPSSGATLTVSSVHSSLAAADPYSGTVAVPAATTEIPGEVSANVGNKVNGYQLVYAADIPTGQDWWLNEGVSYSIDYRAARPFDRVAYYMELVSTDGATTNWVWMSCDKFTDGLSTRELSIPVGGDGAPGRYRLSNLDVASNVSGITTGAHTTGVAELWSSVYYNSRQDDSWGGSGSVCDWNDWWSDGDRNRFDGYGCFQFFATSDDLATGETLFAINGWGKGPNGVMDVGLGTCPNADNIDWTWAANATSYGARRIYAFARPASTDVPAEVVDKVGASADGYKLLYRIDLESSMTVNNGNYGNMSVNTEVYNRIHGINNASTLSQYGYSRVAYCLELVAKDTQATSWIWTAFDWQGDKFAALDIPTAEGGVWAKMVTDLEVKSNVGGIVTGENIATGNIEFSPYNYWTPNNNYNNTYIVPNANQNTCDFGDHLYGIDNDGVGHYACMQVHNYGAQQTLWVVNHFNGGPDNGNEIAVGIGNNSGYHPDWTNEQTGHQYEKMTLYVMIQTCPKIEPQRAVVAQDRRQVCVTCMNEVAVVDPAWLSVDGVTPSAVRVSSTDPHDIILDFGTALAETGTHTVQIAVPGAAARELSCASPRALPACLASVAEASGYLLVNDLAIRGSAPNYSTQGVDYITEEALFGKIPFDRVGYLFELKSNGQDDYRWVWVSMDKFTDDIEKIAVPTVKNDGLIQKLVSNLHVEAGSASGVAPVKTGTWADGNIEFTPFNYESACTFNLEGASSSLWDFDDTLPRQSDAGYACMQVHNYRERETVFAFNHYNWDATPCVTIGNASGDHPDGTFLDNAQNFEVIDLRVFVRPASIAQSRGNGPVFYLQPQKIKYEPNGRETVTLTSLAPEANYYQWFKDGAILPGATACDLSVLATRESAGVYQVVAYFDDDNYTVSEPAVLKPKEAFVISLQ